MLPAQRGDCLWLTYGARGAEHHVLVDGGPQETVATLVPELERRIAALPGAQDRVELLVVTHVDADHVQGLVSLLSDPTRVRLFRDVWFNGYEHLAPHLLGAVDGEVLTRALRSEPGRWNAAFSGGPIARPARGPLPTVALPGGLTLTVLAPDREALARLAPEWLATCAGAGIVAGQGAELRRASWRRGGLLGGLDIDALARAPYRRDTSRPNATSISLVAEHEGRRVLLLGDAPAEQVAAGLDRMGPGPHRFAAVKLSHHGSRASTSPALLARIRSRHWLVSTDGARFHHPDPETIARVVVSQSRPVFTLNHVTDDVAEIIESAGDRYTVRTPRRRRDGTWTEGIVHTVA